MSIIFSACLVLRRFEILGLTIFCLQVLSSWLLLVLGVEASHLLHMLDLDVNLLQLEMVYDYQYVFFGYSLPRDTQK